MNRRDLIKHGPLALLGIGAAAIGVKASEASTGQRGPELDEIHVFVHAEPSKPFRDAVVKSVIDDAKSNGRNPWPA
jgi:hypothetical protein